MSNSKQPTIIESWGGATRRSASEVRFPTAATSGRHRGRGSRGGKSGPKRGRGRGRGGGKKTTFDADSTVYLDEEDDICRQALG